MMTEESLEDARQVKRLRDLDIWNEVMKAFRGYCIFVFFITHC
jgi:hypothetical protein